MKLAASAQQGLRNGEGASREIDVTPAQPEQLAAPQTDGQGTDPQRFETITPDCFDQAPGFLDRQCPPLLLADRRGPDGKRGVTVQQLLAYRVA